MKVSFTSEYSRPQRANRSSDSSDPREVFDVKEPQDSPTATSNSDRTTATTATTADPRLLGADAAQALRLPTLTLRALVTLGCVVIVLVVSVFNITLSFELSRRAVEELGFTHVETLLGAARNKVEDYLNGPVHVSNAMRLKVSQLTDGQGFPLPHDDPDPLYYRKWQELLEGPMIQSNNTIYHVFMLLGDGSVGRSRRIGENGSVSSYYIYSPERPEPNEFTMQRYVADQNEVDPPVAYPFPTRHGLSFPLWQRAIGHSGMRPGYLFWDDISQIAMPSALMGAITTPLHNASGAFLGHTNVAILLRDLGDFLRNIDDDGEHFAMITNGAGYVVASTQSFDFVSQFVPCPDGETCPNPNPSICSVTPPVAAVQGFVCLVHAVNYSDSSVLSGAARAVPRILDSAASPFAVTATIGGEVYFVASAAVQPLIMNRMDWRVTVLYREQKIMGGIFEARNTSIAVSIACLLAGAIFIFLLVFYLMHPVSIVAENIAKAARFQRTSLPDRVSKLREIAKLQNAYMEMAAELHRLRRFVPPAIFGDFEVDEGQHHNHHAEETSNPPSSVAERSDGTGTSNPLGVAPSSPAPPKLNEHGRHPTEASKAGSATATAAVVDVAQPTNKPLGNDGGDVIFHSDAASPGADDHGASKRERASKRWGAGTIDTRRLIDATNTFVARRFSVLRYTCSSADSRNITELQEAAALLSGTFIASIMRHGGIIETFTPNSIIATFNAHQRCSSHEIAAFSCAASIAVKLCNAIPAEKQWSITVDATDGAVGTCGSRDFATRISLGEAADVTAKVHPLNIHFLKTRLVVTDRVYRALRGMAKYDFLPIDIISPHWHQSGRHRATTLYRPIRVHEYADGVTMTYKRLFSSFARQDELQRCCEELERLHAEHKLPEGRRIAQQARHLMAVAAHAAPLVDKGDGVVTGATPSCCPASEKECYMRHELCSLWEPVGADDLLKHEEIVHVTDDAEPSTSTQAVKKSLKAAKDDQLVEDSTGLMSLFIPLSQSAGRNNANDSDADADGSPSVADDRTKLDSDGVPIEFADIDHNIWRRALRPVGSGAFSQVYQGMSRHGSVAALKFLPLSAKTTDVESIVNEVQLFSTLRHDNIVRYISCATLETHIVIITEFVACGSLYAVTLGFGSRVPLHTLRRYTSDILAGLEYLHSNAITHSDVKPQNLLLDVEGVVKLADFGSGVSLRGATAAGRALSAESSETSGPLPAAEARTREPRVVGTTWFAAPEAARGDAPTPASDVWSLGVTLLYLASGTLPFRRHDVTAGELGFLQRLGSDPMLRPTTAHLTFGDTKRPETGKSTGEPTVSSAEDATLESFLDFCLVHCCTRDAASRKSVTELRSHPWVL